MNLSIDGTSVVARQGETVLQCALRNLIKIPHLCAHPVLPPFGACRMCVVEIDGMRGFPASCSVPAAEGMVVRTDTPALKDLRRRILELILLEHPSACLVCEKHDLCDEHRPNAMKAGRTVGCHSCNNKIGCDVRALSEELELTTLPIPPVYRGFPLERSDPFIDRDLNLCILCGLCVRICKAHHGRTVIDFVGRGSETRIGEAFGRSLTEAGCRFCGACVDVCPTGSLADRYAKWFGAVQRYTSTTCTLCDEGCAITVHASAQRRAIMARATNPHTPICVLGRFAIPEFLRGSTRLKSPLMRVGKALRPVPWSLALAQIADRLKPFAGAAFALVCDATSTLEDRYVFRRFAQEVMRSPHYLELAPDARGVSHGRLPDGVRAAVLTGAFVDRAELDKLELVIVADCYPSTASERGDYVLPAAVMAEISGTWIDGGQQLRPLRQSCDGPGGAWSDWQIVSALASAMGASGFGYPSVSAVTAEMGVAGVQLQVTRTTAPPAAGDPSFRRTHFRGHRLEEMVRGLADLQVGESTGAAVAVGG